MKTWLAGLFAVLIMSAGMPAMAAGSYFITAEGDISANSYAAGNYRPKKVDSILERISRLRTEIGKGSLVYSADELRILELKLEDTQKQLSVLTHGG